MRNDFNVENVYNLLMLLTLAAAVSVSVMLIWTLRNTFPMMQCIPAGAAQAAGVIRLTGGAGCVTCYIKRHGYADELQ